MMERRSFLANVIAGLVFMKSAMASGYSENKGASSGQKPNPHQGSGAVPARLGTYYEATVPDTLDLAERARLGLHYFDSITDANLNYEMYFGAHFNNQPASMYAHLLLSGPARKRLSRP